MKHFHLYNLLSFFVIVLFINPVYAQKKEITLEAIYKDYTFYAKSVRGINSMKDGLHYTVNSDGKTIEKHRYADGERVETLFNADDYEEIQSFNDYAFSLDEGYILLTTEMERIYRRSFKANYYIFDLSEKKLLPLSGNGKQQLASISPDNKHVAFVRENNIFLVDLKTGKEMQLTHDGKMNEIINGAPDWVYEEEFGFADGFKWSPDGKRIAFYRFDERKVREFFMTIFGELYPEAYTFKYPKAGEENAEVEIRVYDLSNGKTSRIEIPESKDCYIPRIKWTNEPEVLSIIWLNRLQNHVRILHANVRNGKTTEIYEEKNEKYISEATDDMITYLDDKESFVLISERDGYFHFYHYNFKKKELKPVTSGDWDIHSLEGIDKKNGVIYYTSHEDGPTEIQLYSIRTDGTEKKKISTLPGSYAADFSTTFDYYILRHSTANSPAVFALYDRNNHLIRVLEDNRDLAVKSTVDYSFSMVEFIEVPTQSGQLLNGYMIKPTDFDPDKEYPLFIYVYGGPESQNVVNSWSNRLPWFQMLVQKGYIVACVDNRGTNGRGEAFRKSTYMQLGKLETIDQVEAAMYFGDLPYIDKERIGIFGWSYGGFMTSLCLTKGNGIFRMGIAVAPVTNWRYYDTIYTERFMRTPQENPSGYDDNSPINHAGNLQGKFLLIHGTADDNVHFQNSVNFVSALVEADVQFEMQFYPNKNHGIYGGNTTFHLYSRMTDFILENL